MGARLMAIVAEGKRGRVYLSPHELHGDTAENAQPTWKPTGDIAKRMTGGNCTPYGLTTWGDLFTSRQLMALTTFSDLVQEAREKAIADAKAAGHQDDGISLAKGGTGATAYGEAISVYFALATSKMTAFHNSTARWRSGEGKSAPAFGRQAIPMVWDYAEVNPFAGAGGDFSGVIDGIFRSFSNYDPSVPGKASQVDAQTQSISDLKLICTDPPYYDNIGYADLSDFSMSGYATRSGLYIQRYLELWPSPRPRSWWPLPTAMTVRHKLRTFSWMV